jgi:hypothetical protein
VDVVDAVCLGAKIVRREPTRCVGCRRQVFAMKAVGIEAVFVGAQYHGAGSLGDLVLLLVPAMKP